MEAEVSNIIEMMKGLSGYVGTQIDNINDISLEDDLYNELYLTLRELRSKVLPVIKAQHKINQRATGAELWEGLKELRSPSEDFNMTDEKE